MHSIHVGPLNVTVHRTVRVPDGRSAASLPPSLGRAEVHKVSDFRSTCPSTWEDDGVFVGVHSKEAIWLSFDRSRPVAVVIGAGGINAITGKSLTPKLEAGGYLVTPPQPWLDGWKGEDGNVFQFVAAEFKGGDGLTVGEQLLGEKSKTGGIGIAVFTSEKPLTIVSAPSQVGGLGMYKGGAGPMSLRSTGVTRGGLSTEMGLGKGGRIRQRIYPDPYGLEVWKKEPVASAAVYLIDAATFHEITGRPLSPSPVDSEGYSGGYFDLQDEEMKDVEGSSAFVGLKSVFSEDIEVEE